MNGDHLERLEALLKRSPGTLLEGLTVHEEADVRAVMAELRQLRAQRTSLDGQVFISGWYAHAEACASLGWDAREAAWRKYREEMTATLAKVEAAPQQPEDGGERQGSPEERS